MNEKNVAYHIKEHLMKRNILAVCLLVSVCLPIFCTDTIYDGDDRITVSYIGIEQQHGDAQRLQEMAMLPLPNFQPIGAISKLSHRDTELINKALSEFEVKKSEVYFIKIYLGMRGKEWMSPLNIPAKKFFVVITDINKQNYHWTAYGVQGIHCQ